MIVNISDEQFKHIMDNSKLNLPIRWDGKNFEKSLYNLFSLYLQELRVSQNQSDDRLRNITVDIYNIKSICNLILDCVKIYHNGFPAYSYEVLSQVMKKLIQTPLKVYQKNGCLQPIITDNLYLFRLRKVNDNTNHSRREIFHVPASARSDISTCRYSIAGYPSLYLTTSIKLGLEEIAKSRKNVIVSRFKLNRNISDLNIRVLELGIKPQDFYENREQNWNERLSRRYLRDVDLYSNKIRSNYLLWYPLIASCSFIRANKDTPFSSEYIVPQLLMQWVRGQIGGNNLMGIRYFSCASVRASDMGFDYVFPVSNTDYEDNYCSILRDSFSLTEPVFIKEYDSIKQCEVELINSFDFQKI